MIAESQIPEPILFNPLKYQPGYAEEFICQKTEGEENGDQKVRLQFGLTPIKDPVASE